MNAVRRLRHAPRLVFAIALVVALSAVAAALAATPAIQTITPNSADRMTNIDVARQQAKNYYGAPLAVAGSNPTTATWDAPLNLESNYAHEAESVAAKGESWLKARSKVKDRAVVLDVDDTTLTTWNYELFSNWDFNFGTNQDFVGLNGALTFTGNMFPATPGMVDLVDEAKALGYAVFWITGRGDSQHQATIANLVSDEAAGVDDIATVSYAGKTVPEIDAGYPLPTPLDTGHGGFADGLFTKPSAAPVNTYPSYLDKPEFCADAIAAKTSCPTIQYKSGTRAYIESQGYDIVANFGDQFSDLEGGFADKTFKMPNPNYFLP
jgi:predicted secreted acid phosphatase